MMSSTGEFWQKVQEVSKGCNNSPVQIGQVTSKIPLVISFNGLELSYSNGDKIYLNQLLLDDNIDLDVSSLDSAQDIGSMSPAPWIAEGSANADYTATISGTQKQFLIDLYDWIKAVHARYIISVGDYVAVQKLGNNAYLVLEKVQQRVENEQ